MAKELQTCTGTLVLHVPRSTTIDGFLNIVPAQFDVPKRKIRILTRRGKDSLLIAEISYTAKGANVTDITRRFTGAELYDVETHVLAGA